MIEKDRKLLKRLSSHIWAEQSVDLPQPPIEDLRVAISNIKVVECSSDRILSELKKLKNYDYFLIIKIENSHYFFDTSRIEELEESYGAQPSPPLILLKNYNVYVRREKMKKLKENE